MKLDTFPGLPGTLEKVYKLVRERKSLKIKYILSKTSNISLLNYLKKKKKNY